MDPLARNVRTLSRIKHASLQSTAGRYMALFKVVLCAWGEIVGEVVFVCAIQFEARKDRSCGIAVESGSSFHKVDHHFMMWVG
jgi:hypothetical protein